MRTRITLHNLEILIPEQYQKQIKHVMGNDSCHSVMLVQDKLDIIDNPNRGKYTIFIQSMFKGGPITTQTIQFTKPTVSGFDVNRFESAKKVSEEERELKEREREQKRMAEKRL